MGDIKIFDRGDKPQAWIEFDEDTEVLLEYTEKDDLEEIRAIANKQAKLARTDNTEGIFNVLLGKRKVKDWRKRSDHSHPGLLVNGEPFPFSEENVVFLMKRSLDFSSFVNETCLRYKNFDQAEREREVKNS
ncbi:MAG TPA: hypothetical protein ENH31_00325 [Nitrospirae bacterium]|nr:hypothetical protein [Nitrospirota bacterium]HDK17147.1 hypothetical protein [Nitrospirota bacterium]HDK80997.1 hypothetical protein [Nitrospirota bacterium]